MCSRRLQLELEEEFADKPNPGFPVWWQLRLEALAKYLVERLDEEGYDEDDGPSSTQA
jgi:hypothetical protein